MSDEVITSVVDNPPLSSIGNKKVRAKVEKFVQTILDNKHKRFVVCSHDNPDPDSIACVCGMIWILQFLEVDHVIGVYCGEISHPQNKTMVNILSIGINRWDESLAKEYADAFFIYVDCSSPNQKNVSIGIEPSIVIDHHKTTAPRSALAINDEVGACATLITDLALMISKPKDESSCYHCFDPDVDGIKELATALAVGIKEDTIDFRNETTTDEDFAAYRLMSGVFSEDKFKRIINYELPPYFFEFEGISWQNKNDGYTPNFITGLGYLESGQTDVIPYLADKYMRIKGVQTVVVFGMIEDENSIRACARSISSSIDCSNLVNELFGEGYGGGKNGSGGARVPVMDFLITEMDDQSRKEYWELWRKKVTHKFSEITAK